MFYYNMHLAATGIQKMLLQQCQITNAIERTRRKKTKS